MGRYERAQVCYRAALEAGLKLNGIPAAIHYPVGLHQQPAYAEFAPGASLPNAERLARELISVPMHPYLSESVQDRIAGAVRQALV